MLDSIIAGFLMNWQGPFIQGLKILYNNKIIVKTLRKDRQESVKIYFYNSGDIPVAFSQEKLFSVNDDNKYLSESIISIRVNKIQNTDSIEEFNLYRDILNRYFNNNRGIYLRTAELVLEGKKIAELTDVLPKPVYRRNLILYEREKESISELRSKIDELDRDLFFLLAQRLQLARKIGKIKAKTKKGIYDRRREYEILKNLKDFCSKYGHDEETRDSLVSIYNIIFESCRHLQDNKYRGDICS